MDKGKKVLFWCGLLWFIVTTFVMLHLAITHSKLESKLWVQGTAMVEIIESQEAIIETQKNIIKLQHLQNTINHSIEAILLERRIGNTEVNLSTTNNLTQSNPNERIAKP